MTKMAVHIIASNTISLQTFKFDKFVRVVFVDFMAVSSLLFDFSTTWHQEPYTRGSYSALGVGGNQSHIEKLTEPLYQRPHNRTVSEFLKRLKILLYISASKGV